MKIVGDIDEYRADRGLYFAPEEVPGADAIDVEGARALLADALADAAAFVDAYEAQTRRFGPAATGRESRAVIDAFFGGRAPERTFDFTDGRDRPSIMIYGGGLAPNGITASLCNLIASIHDSVDVYLQASRQAIEAGNSYPLKGLAEMCRVIPSNPSQLGTQMEREVLTFFASTHYVPSDLTVAALRRSSRREAWRHFGDARFDAVVDFNSYDARRTAYHLLGLDEQAAVNGVFLHNEWQNEVTLRFPKLAAAATLLPRASFIASVSPEVAAQNAEYLAGFGVDPGSSTVIHNALDVPRLRALAAEPLETEDREWYGRPGKHVVVAGRFSAEKNHAELLHAMRDYLDRAEPTPLTVTLLGAGHLERALRAQAEALDLVDVVRFRGQVENAFAHMVAADAVLLPSRYEGQPMVLLEALALGTPAVATRIPGSTAVLHDGEYGLLVPLGRDGILQGLEAIARGQLVPSNHFDPEAYNREAVDAFLGACGVAV